MSVSLLNLREQIKLDYKISGDADFPAARLNLLINQAQRFVQMQLNGLGIKRWETSISFTGGTLPAAAFLSTANNVKSVPISSLTNLAESPNAIRFIQTVGGTTWNQAKEVNEAFVNEHLGNSLNTPSLADSIFWRSDGTVYIAPSTVTTAIIHFYKVVTDLSGDSDATEIPVEFTEHIVKRAGIDIETIRGNIQDKENEIVGLSNSITGAWQKFLEKQQLAEAQKKQTLN